MKIAKVTSKGQITIPQEAREDLAIDEGTYLEVTVANDEIRLRKVVSARPLASDDPIWALLGAGRGGTGQASADHDRVLADAEISGWRESS